MFRCPLHMILPFPQGHAGCTPASPRDVARCLLSCSVAQCLVASRWTVPCCLVLSCAVLCCLALSCAVLCCLVLSCAVHDLRPTCGLHAACTSLGTVLRGGRQEECRREAQGQEDGEESRRRHDEAWVMRSNRTPSDVRAR